MRLLARERLRTALMGATLAIACDRADAPSRVETASGATVAALPSGEPAEDPMRALGSLLVVPFDSAGTGIVIYPAMPTTQLVSSAPLTLIAPNGDSTRASAVLAATDSQVCGEAPLVRIQDSLATVWSVAVLGTAITPVRLDSIETLSRPDSTRLVAELARLASAIPMPGNSRFKGLPFAVSYARVFVEDGTQIAVSQLVRRVPHEAAPVEERTFIVAERDSATRSFSMAYQLRSEGTEDSAEHFEVLTVVRGAPGVWLLLSRDNTAQTTYEVLERVRPAVWRPRWSRVLSC